MTPQYSGLESLFKKYKDDGFRVLAFPANNFANQEPGTNSQIKKFCSSRFNITFDLFAKVSVKGDDQCPLYRFLTTHPDKAVAGEIAWNFQKYLIGRDGKVLAKFGPRTTPDSETLVQAVKNALAIEVASESGKTKGEVSRP